MQRVFVFVDVAGFSALTEVHGDVAAAELVNRFERLIRDLAAPGGRLVKTMGDGALIVFSEASPAIAFADALIAEAEGMPGRPGVKIGMNRGTAVESESDYVGHAVNVAARVAAQAESCQILVTAPVREALTDSGLMAWRGLGTRQLKNIAEPVELFLLLRDECNFVVDPVCRMRLDASEGITRITGGITHHFCSGACADTFVEGIVGRSTPVVQ